MKKVVTKFLLVLSISFTTLQSCSSDSSSANASNPPGTIGTQNWTTKNLDVDHYRDGTPIPQVTDPTEWEALTTGAWCYHNNDPANGQVYGKLYNWYAVTDPRGLAPIGYHVPNNSDWTTLITFLGGESVAGGKMKESGTTHWESPNTGATNTSGFTGLPGGFRNYDGFFNIGSQGYWWSLSEADAYYAWYRILYNNNGSPNSYYNNKTNGFSVRCIRD